MTTVESGRPAAAGRDSVVLLLVAVILVAVLEVLRTTGGIAELGALEPVGVLVRVVLALFAPGFLLLHLAGVTFDRPTRGVVYVVGLSSGFLLVVTVTTTLALGPAGLDVERPFAAVGWAFLTGVVGLGVAALLREGSRRPLFRDVEAPDRALPWFLALCLLPLLAVAGARLLTATGRNSLALVVVGLVALVPVAIGTGVLPRELHPVAVWSVSLSVLLGMTLVTDHLWGWDVHFQYATARRTLAEGAWTFDDGVPSNSLLTTTLLAAAYASVTDLELVWVYKLVYAFLASTLPVVVYHASDSVFEDHRVAALGPFALTFYYGFFKFFPDKQVVSLLFFALTLLALFEDWRAGVGRRALALVFGGLLILSHYGVSLLFVGFIAAGGLAVAFVRDAGVLDDAPEDGNHDGGDPELVRPTFVLVLAVAWYVWFRYSAGGVNLARIVEVGHETLVAFEGGGGSDRSGAGYVTRALTSPLWTIYTALNAVLLGLVSLGVVQSLFAARTRERQATQVYVAVAAVVLAFLATSVVAIYGMGFDRTLLVGLVVLAPFAPVGLRTGLQVPLRVTIGERVTVSRDRTAAILGVFLAVFFLFSSGAVFVVADDTVPPYSLAVDDDAEWHTYADSELAASRWLERRGATDREVAVYNEGGTLKSRDGVLVAEVVDQDRIELVRPGRTDYEGGAYVYVSERPMAVETDSPERAYLEPGSTAFHDARLATGDVVYATDSATIYRVPDSADGENQSSELRSDTGDDREQEDAI